ncbi:MAG: polysaccharide deacetylase family protein [Bacillota bacterium]|nr:polysaccharide deacetylase family protein [Bacillota bacterium]HHU29842.1 polysaccharide deacetylase family protein [Bacillota bacterium]
MKIKFFILPVILLVLLVACATTGPKGPAQKEPDPVPALPGSEPEPGPEPEPEPAAEPPFDFALYKPNELGEIPVLMYHNILEPEAVWTRTPDNFRADLQRFYDLGYRPVSLTDVVTNNINIPAGTSPLVLTFDDGSAGHFRLIKNEKGEIIVDPDCAVQIILDFAGKHPEMGTAATFFVHLPHPFAQADSWYTGEHRTWKLEKLVEWGMEIGNHTLNHLNLRRDIKSPQQLLEQLGKPHRLLAEILPAYKMNSLSLPYGIGPLDEWKDYLYSGEYQGTAYRHDAVVLVGSGPAKPYNHKDYSPAAMPRIRASNYPDGGESNFLDRALERLTKTRYISDGDPDTVTFPESALESFNEESLGDKKLRCYRPEE